MGAWGPGVLGRFQENHQNNAGKPGTQVHHMLISVHSVSEGLLISARSRTHHYYCATLVTDSTAGWRALANDWL